MKKVSLSGSPRENVGKKDTKALRKAGRVPCSLYGGEKQVHFSVNALDLNKIVHSADIFQIELDIDGRQYNAVIKEMQFHPVHDNILHVDFQELIPDKKIKIKLPVRVTGNSIGVRNGGKLLLPYRMLTLRGYPEAFPEAVEIDITELRIGGKLRVSDIQLSDKISILEPADTVVVLVKTSRNVAADAIEAADAEAAASAGGVSEAAPAEEAAAETSEEE